jgi:hypothetical protein
MSEISRPDATIPLKDPVERIREFEKLSVTADLPGVLRCIGDIHELWASLNAAQRFQVIQREAIFLTLLQARKSKRA